MLQSMGSQRIRQDCATELETPLENRCSILVLSHFNMPTNHLEILLKNKQTKIEDLAVIYVRVFCLCFPLRVLYCLVLHLCL